MLKTIILGLIVAMSSSTAANIMSPTHPLSPLNPLSLSNPNSIYYSSDDEVEEIKDKYEQRLVYFYKAEPQTSSYSYVVLYDYKTKLIMRQRACSTVNNKVKKKYVVSYNLTRKYYALSCVYLK